MSSDDTIPEPELRQVSVAQLRAWAQGVLDNVHIENVRLKDLETDSAEALLPGPYDVTTEISFRGLQSAAYGGIETAVRYIVTCVTTSDDIADDANEAWRVECELRAAFAANDPETPLPPFDKDHRDAFAMVIGVIHVHPYARETVQSVTGRLGYPPFTLDGLTPISAFPDAELIEFPE